MEAPPEAESETSWRKARWGKGGKSAAGLSQPAKLPHPGLQGEPDGLRVPVPRVQGHFDFAHKDVATQAFAVPHGQAQHAVPELSLRDGVLGTGGAL